MPTAQPLDSITERLLVLRAAEGDGAAFRVLWDAYEAKLRYFLRRIVAEEHTADDVLQEVALELFRKLPRLRAIEAFRRWLYQVAHDRAVSRVRKERREKEVLECALSEQEASSVDEFQQCELAEAVHFGLNQLDEDERTVLTLRFLEDLRIAEIAEVLRLPEGTVKSRLHYAKQSLRRVLQKDAPS